MTLYKRGGVWWMNFWVDEHHVQKTTKCTNKRDAAEVERAFRTQLAKREVGLEPKKPVPIFSAAMKEFLEWSKHEHAPRPNTHRRYETASKPLLKFFNDRPLDQIKPELIEQFKLWRIKQKKKAPSKKIKKLGPSARTDKALKPATVNRELACLKLMLNYFIKSDVLTRANPVSRVNYLAEDNEQMRILTQEEEKLYLLAASQPLQDIATLMVETGMRPEEVFRIRRENVHLEQGYLFNPYGKTKAAKRKVPLSERASAVLAKRLADLKGNYLFQGRGKADNPIVKVNNGHRAAVTRSGLEHFRLYDLRHTWASRAAMAGVDLVTLAALLGHSRVQMVMRYAHPTEEHQFQAVQKMQRFVAGELKKLESKK